MVRIKDETISYKMCAVKVRNAKLRNYLKESRAENKIQHDIQRTLNYKISTISENIFSRFINTLNICCFEHVIVTII